MIDIRITKRFNNDVMFPRDIYTIDIYKYEDGRREKGMAKTILSQKQRTPKGKTKGILCQKNSQQAKKSGNDQGREIGKSQRAIQN